MFLLDKFDKNTSALKTPSAPSFVLKLRAYFDLSFLFLEAQRKNYQIIIFNKLPANLLQKK